MQPKAGRLALTVALIYVIVAGGWILFSDKLLAATVSDDDLRTKLSIIKGWAFVVLTGGLLHQVIRHLLRRWEREAEQRRQAEANLRPTERALRTLSDCNQALVRATNEPALLREICRVMVESGGYQLACVGFAENDAQKTVRIAAHAGHDEGYLAQAQISWADTERGRGPTGTCLRTGQITICNDTHTDPNFAPWRAQARQRGFAALIVLPLRNGKITFGALMLYAAEGDAFHAAEVKLLTELADDLAYGIHSLRVRHEQLLAEVALQQGEQNYHLSQERYQALFERSLDCVFLNDFEGRFLDANQAALNLLGYQREEINTLTFGSLLTADQLSLAMQTLEELRTTGFQKQRTELRLRRKDGGEVFVEILCSLIRRGGKPYAIQGIARDITERKQTDATLRESEQRYRQLFELESDAVILVDIETHRYVDVNQAALRLYGYSREEMLAMKPEDVSAEPEKTRATVGSGHVFVPLRWHRKKGGERFAVEITANQIQHQGRRTELATVRDITARQQVMDQLRETTGQLLEAQRIAGLGSYIFNARTGVWTCSELLDELFGLTDAGFTKDVNGWLQIIHPEERADMERYLHEEVLQGKAAFDRTYRIIRRNDQQERWIHGLGKLVLDSHGLVVQMVGVIQDITERKRAENLLRQSEERYRNLIDNARDAIFTIACDGTFTSLNPAVAGIAGVSLDDWLGRPFLPMVHPEDVPLAREMFQRILADKPVPVHQVRGNPKLKRPAIMEMTLAALKDASGKITGVFGIGRDITERNLAEAALQESRALYHSLVAQLPVGVFRKEHAGRYVFVNAEFCRLKGMTAEDFLEKTPLEVAASEAAQRDAAGLAVKYAATGEDHHQQIMRTGKLMELDEEYLLADGRKHYVHCIKLPVVNPEGKVTGSQGVIFDITERTLAEERLNLQSSALVAADNAIVITNRSGKIEWVNPAFTKLTGYSAAEAIGGFPRLLKSGQHPPAFYAAMWSTIGTGKVWRGELVNKRKDGSLYTEDMTITPVRSASDEIAHFVAIKLDVSERRLLENRLQQAQKMEAIGTLAGGIAHDFNNILAAMFGYAYLLQQDTEGNPTAQENIGEILKATSRAKDLVQQILTFSRQRDLKRQVIRLDTVVKEAMKFLRASLPADIKIEMHLADDAPAVLADPTQIYQVMINLATNALHAMEGRGGKLAVTLEAFSPTEKLLQAHPDLRPAAYTRLTITDTGHGMDAKTQARIFEPFFTTKPVGKGTGLGLAVVHGIIQSHEGVINVESQPGEGTSFLLYFPAQTVAAAATDTKTRKLHHGRGQRILLVDDEPALTGVFKQLLRRLNYEAIASNSAAEALGWFREKPTAFDLVITDLTMPEMNGLEIAREVRTLRPDMPVVLATGYTSTLNHQHLLDAGICELLEKPVSMTALADVLERVFGKP